MDRDITIFELEDNGQIVNSIAINKEGDIVGTKPYRSYTLLGLCIKDHLKVNEGDIIKISGVRKNCGTKLPWPVKAIKYYEVCGLRFLGF